MTDPREEITEAAEERWTTVRRLVWQGWDQDVHPSWHNTVSDAGRFMVDDDGGLWFEADPETCETEGKHIPRLHPSEVSFTWFYCVRCGAQGLSGPEVVDAARLQLRQFLGELDEEGI